MKRFFKQCFSGGWGDFVVFDGVEAWALVGFPLDLPFINEQPRAGLVPFSLLFWGRGRVTAVVIIKMFALDNKSISDVNHVR